MTYAKNYQLTLANYFCKKYMSEVDRKSQMTMHKKVTAVLRLGLICPKNHKDQGFFSSPVLVIIMIFAISYM